MSQPKRYMIRVSDQLLNLLLVITACLFIACLLHRVLQKPSLSPERARYTYVQPSPLNLEPLPVYDPLQSVAPPQESRSTPRSPGDSSQTLIANTTNDQAVQSSTVAQATKAPVRPKNDQLKRTPVLQTVLTAVNAIL